VRVALDATYSIDPRPSGIAVYSRELLRGLAAAHPEDEFLHCYRLKQFLRARGERQQPNVHRRLLIPPVPTFRARIFHALNQRVDRRPAKNVISTFHDLFVLTGEYSTPAFRERFSKQARQAAQNSDLIIAVSEFTASQLTALLGVPRKRIRVVPHGVHPPREQTTAARENRILFVGTLQIRKNILRLVEAFEFLPPEWTLTLAGAASGFGIRRILERIHASPAAPRIQITGYLSAQELDALFQKSSIFAFPSLDEGFGMPVLQAMAHGVPVVTSNRSALPEVAGDAALLVNPFKTEEIASALLQLATDADLRMKLAAAGKIRARDFTWEKAVERTYAAYKELTG